MRKQWYYREFRSISAEALSENVKVFLNKNDLHPEDVDISNPLPRAVMTTGDQEPEQVFVCVVYYYATEEKPLPPRKE